MLVRCTIHLLLSYLKWSKVIQPNGRFYGGEFSMINNNKLCINLRSQFIEQKKCCLNLEIGFL